MISEEMQVERSRFEREDAVQAAPPSTGCSIQTEWLTNAESTQTDGESSTRPRPGHQREISVCSTASDDSVKYEPVKKEEDKGESRSAKGKHDSNTNPNEIFFHLVHTFRTARPLSASR